MLKEKRVRWAANGTAAIMAWGVTAYTYINTGFSIAMIAFALFFLGTLWAERSLPKIPIDRRLLWAFGLLYGTLFATTLFHLEHPKNLSGGYYCLSGFLMYTASFWMLLYVGGKYDVRKAVVYTLYAVLFAMCGYGIIKYFMLGEYRLTSFYSLGTRVAMMLDMFLPFTVAAAAYYRKNRKIFLVSEVLLVLEIIAFILVKVRGTYLAFVVALVVTFLVWAVQQRGQISSVLRKRIGLAVGILIAVLVVYGVSIGWGSMHRMLGEERLLMWESTVYMWADHPLTGIGLNDWQSLWANSEYTHPLAREHGAVHPHNVFLYFFATAGTPGGLAYLTYCALVFFYLIGKTRQHGANPFNWAMLFMFIAVMAHGLVDQSFILKLTGRIFYFMLGYSLIADWWYEKDRKTLAEEEKAG